MTSYTPTVRVALHCANILGESAVWSVKDQSVYWVDIREPALHAFAPGAVAHKRWPMPEKCCGVALSNRGLIVALENALYRFDPAGGTTSKLVEIEPRAANNRLNEMRCDRSGRIWVGSMRDFGAARTGSLYRVAEDLDVRRVLTDIRTPNSLAWSPDGRKMYFADTGEGVIRRYDFDEDGALGVMDAFLGSDALPGKPDGSCVDADGYVWNTRVRAGRIVRLAPDGSLDRAIDLPALLPTSCCLGGPDFLTLYVTTSRQNLTAEQMESYPASGDLLCFETSTPGLPEPEFQIN